MRVVPCEPSDEDAPILDPWLGFGYYGPLMGGEVRTADQLLGHYRGRPRRGVPDLVSDPRILALFAGPHVLLGRPGTVRREAVGGPVPPACRPRPGRDQNYYGRWFVPLGVRFPQEEQP